MFLKKIMLAGVVCASMQMWAQSASQLPEEPPAMPGEPLPPPHGTVIFSRSVASETQKMKSAQAADAAMLTATDAERNAVTFTQYDLDIHLEPAKSMLAMRVHMTIRNDGSVPLLHLPLQISSSLHWESVQVAGRPAEIAPQMLETDADHTGALSEITIPLETPLAPDASVAVTAIYSGTITQSAERLERIGAPAGTAMASDWDRITPEFTALRGFGNVIWYPVAAPALFLGDGAKLFQATGQMKLRETMTRLSLRLSVDFTGRAPALALLNGVSMSLTATGDAVSAEAGTPRVATASMSERPLGFRTMNFFLVQIEKTSDAMLAAYVLHPEWLKPYADAVAQVAPLLTDWLGTPPITPLTLVELPEADDRPFEEDGVLMLPLAAKPDAEQLPLQMVHALARTWISHAMTGKDETLLQPRAWMNEGLAQFFGLLWVEQTHGREAALAEMNSRAVALALAEPDLSDTAEAKGESLVLATDEIIYRTKAAQVWWMLRELVGEVPLQKALQAYREQAMSEREPSLFQKILEQTSKKDLEWFFDDWVYRDRGLPEISIANVVPRQVLGKDEYLVAVEVANDGYAATDVPVTVRTGRVSITERLRVPARQHATTRILFVGKPEEVQVNDDSVPEVRATIHRTRINLPAQK